MVLQTTYLSNSIRLSSIQTTVFKTGVISFSLTRPLTAERDAAAMVLAGVLRRGTEQYPTQAHINRALDDLYAACIELRSSRIGKNLSLVMTAEVLDDRYIPDQTDVLGGTIQIAAQMLLHPYMEQGCFPHSSVKQELVCVRDMLHAQKNNTRSYAAIRCSELMRRNDPSFPSLTQTEELVETLNGQSLYEHYREWMSDSVLDVFYVGSETTEAVSERVLSAFSDFSGTTKTPLTPISQEAPTPFCSLTESMPVAQGKLSMGFRTGTCVHPNRTDYYTALVLNELFGASPASKLFLNVREKMNICYYCSSSFSIYSGNLMVSCGMESEKKEIAEQAILDQLEQIRQGKISDIEFSAAKKSLENCYRSLEDSPFDLQSFYGGRLLFGITDSISDCRQKLAVVSIEDVVALARQTVYDTSFFVNGTQLNDGEEDEEDD